MNMLPVSTDELGSIRADVADAVCDLPCVIQRKVLTKDAYGSATESLVVVSPDDLLAGMKEPTAGQMQMYASKLGSLGSWQVQFAYGTDVRVNDLLLIAGHTMTVQVDYSPQSYNTLTTVLASEVMP